MSKIKIDLTEDSIDNQSEETNRTLSELTRGLPSISRSKMEGLKYANRVQLSFTNVPKPIKEAFDNEARNRKMSKKEFLYECMRAAGLDIPQQTEIDGRRR